MTSRAERIAALKAAAQERILILDGSWGVMIQRRGLAEADYRGERFADHHVQLKGDNDLLCLTRPDIIADLHDAYFDAGADIAETNTFIATSITQADYELQGAVRDINLAGARLAREAADRWTAKTPDKPRFVAGAIGPLNRDALDVVRRQRSGRAQGDLRPGLRRLSRAGAGAARGRRRSLPGRDHLRHAERQGGDQGDPRPRGRGLRAAADLDLRHHHRPLRPHALGPDGGGVLELGAPRAAVRRGPQLRAGRRADAPAHRRAGAHRRHPGRRLSRTPACPTPSASTTRARTRPPASWRSGPRAASSTSSAAAAAPRPTTSATSPRR